MYLWGSGVYKDKVSGAYIILNELLTCVYYVFLSLPYLSSFNSSKEIASYCIKILLAALALNILTNVILLLSKIRNCIKNYREKKNNKITPIVFTDVNNNKNAAADFQDEKLSPNTFTRNSNKLIKSFS